SLELAEQRTVAGRSCHVLGAGGAARAIVRALAEAGASEVVVVNRTPGKAAAAAALAGPVGRVGSAVHVESADIVVNATSVGMAGTPGAHGVPLDVEMLRSGQTVVDLVYHPLRTPLLEAAEAAGAHAVGGLGMLVHQAARQFELWTGVDAPLEAMLAEAGQRMHQS
ncbi:MAG: shikimate dehydrogenase, partial [Acidimicrobiales bacterium]